MTDPKLMGFAIRVRIPGGDWEYYGTMASNQEEALVVVSDDLKTTNEEVEFHQVLTDGVAKAHSLERGKVKKLR